MVVVGHQFQLERVTRAEDQSRVAGELPSPRAMQCGAKSEVRL